MSQSETTFNEAKQIYLETYGDAITTGTYLKATVAVLALIVLGLVILNLKTIQTFRGWRPLVIRVDDIGRAQALDYRSLEYHPGDAEAKYFLSEFCQLYYRRNRYTINDDFTKALYFLDGKLANDIIQHSKSDDTINKFLSDPGSAQVDVDVQKVTLQPMIKAPYQASVDFYRVEYAPADHSVIRKTLFTATFLFMFKDQVPSELIPIDPLGLTITYFRQDQAFTDEVHQ